jgi:hypothetical protein
MQIPPLDFTDLILLSVAGALILLFMAELTSPQYGLTNLTINKKKLRRAALATSLMFLITIILEIIGIMYL